MTFSEIFGKNLPGKHFFVKQKEKLVHTLCHGGGVCINTIFFYNTVYIEYT